MLAALAILSGIALGLLSGGSLRRLAGTSLRGEAAILGVFVIQALARGPLLPVVGRYSIIIWSASALTLIGLLLVQRRLPGMIAIASGIVLNSLVILLNGGMPVTPPAGSAQVAALAVTEKAGFYVLADTRTYLAALGDVLPFANGLASAGDVLLAVGICVLIAYIMQASNTTKYCI